MRRIPRSPLAATVAVLLVGCKSPLEVAPPQPPPPVPSLSVEIAGPSHVDNNGLFSWEAVAFGGTGKYTYQWEVTRQTGQAAATIQEDTTTTQRRLSLLVTAADGDFALRLTVTSADQVIVENFLVRNCVNGCRT